MKITDFTKEITSYEGKKKNIDIAQIGEILRIINELTNGELYKIIRNRNSTMVLPKMTTAKPASGRIGVTTISKKSPTSKK